MSEIATPEYVEVRCRDVSMRMSVTTPRLKVWADNFARIEPELLDAIDAQPPASVMFDVGASSGLFSVYGALKRDLRVFAFEAEAQNFAALDQNSFLNRERLAGRLSAFCLAVSDRQGVGKLHIRLYGAGEHTKTLNEPRAQDTKEVYEASHVQTVLTMRLDALIDQFALPRPNFLKIDVDGVELAVLRGADRILADPALATVFIELSEHGGPPGEAVHLKRFGFRCAGKHPVVRLSGGFYPDLYNCIFVR